MAEYTISGKSLLLNGLPRLGMWRFDLPRDGYLPSPGEVRWGVTDFTTDETGEVTADLEATTGDEHYIATFIPADSKQRIVQRTFQLTGNMTIDEVLGAPEWVPIGPSQVALAEAAKVAAEAARDAAVAAQTAAEAVGDSNDTIVAALVPASSGSATAAALSATIVTAVEGTPTRVNAFEHDSTRLATFRAAMTQRAMRPVNMLFIGDSNTEGHGTLGANTDGRWMSLVRDNLRATAQPAGIAGGEGYVPGYYISTTMTDRWSTVAGAPTTVTYGGLGRRMLQMTSGNKVSMTFTGTDIDLLWDKHPNGGTFVWTIDGGADSAPVSTVKTGDHAGGQVTSLTGLTPGSHTVTVRHSGASAFVLLEGAMVYNGDRTAGGIRVWDGAASGYRTGDFVPNSGANWADAVTVVQPDLVTISLGINDYAKDGSVVDPALVQGNLTTLIAAVRAKCSTDPSIILQIPFQCYEAAPIYPWADYRAAIIATAAADGRVALHDLSAVLGDFPTLADPNDVLDPDNIHMNAKGHRLVAQSFLGLINPM